MSGGSTSKEKPEILIYGPAKPTIVEPLRDIFTLRYLETSRDIDRLPQTVAAKIRGVAVTGLVPVESEMLSHCP